MPARIARVTSAIASSRGRPSRYPASNTAIAFNDPDPMVANGRASVEPCG